MSFSIIDVTLLDELTTKARASERLRSHHNLHEALEEPFQRLLIAVEPGTYIPPHRHTEPAKPECILTIRGLVGFVLFNNDGRVLRQFTTGRSTTMFGCDLHPGTWHTIVSLESGSVILEGKPGPYEKIEAVDIAPWSPEPGTPESVSYVQNLAASFQPTDDTPRT